ncbi:MAG TPA: VTT domain-containing protein [Gemmatimonadaceae bacterium]|nr:VTT domain-containing protein [Gemmatimonadaceae bacterium]
MDQILEFFHRLRDVKALIAWGGYVGLTVIIFAETGLLIGFFLPGDSLLVTAGILASQGHFNVFVLAALLTTASILGNAVGFYIGRVGGTRLFRREESRFFKPQYLRQAHEFYEKHGGKAVVLARFMPIVRTFVPVVAGAAEMNYRRYTTYNVVGGVLWICGMLFTGDFLYRYIPGVDEHVGRVIIIVILLSFVPAFIGWWRARRAPKQTAATTKSESGATPRS